ncbi:MAG: SPFH domain-containing protein [Anaerolineales bacterium]|nr:SPFH domain-containing protein [Anaerolineales bacterium]
MEMITVGLLLLPIWAYAHYKLAVVRAIQNGEQERVLFGGLLKLVLWKPQEGVVFLKRKQIWEVHQDGAGGLRFICPLFGEELGARVALAEQVLTWEDENILTRESLQVRMKVAVWWQATNLRQYAYAIGREGEGKEQATTFGMTNHWLVTLTEGALRTLAATMSIYTLASSSPSAYILEMLQAAEMDNDEGNEEARQFTENLRHRLQQQLEPYGLRVVRVVVQEVSIPDAIKKAIEEAWKTTLGPRIQALDAQGQKAWIETLRDTVDPETLRNLLILRGLKGSNVPIVVPPIGVGGVWPPALGNLLSVGGESPKQLPPSNGEVMQKG